MARPTAEVKVYNNYKTGYISKLGYSTDFFYNDLLDVRGINAELIPSLNCIAPVGTVYPQDMSLTDWTLTGNGNARITNLAGNPSIAYLEYYDGKVYTSGSAWADNRVIAQNSNFGYKNFVVNAIRCSPPKGQQIVGGTIVEMKAIIGGEEGRVFLLLPLNGKTQLFKLVGDFDTDAQDILNPSNTTLISDGDKIKVDNQGVARESWLIETVTDSDRFNGSHIIIRNTKDLSKYWITYDKDVVVTNTELKLQIFGSVQHINISPIYYQPSSCDIVNARQIPNSPDFNYSETWYQVDSIATDWTTTVTNVYTNVSPNYFYAPHAVFTPSGGTPKYNRPFIWSTSMLIAATVDTDSSSYLDTTLDDNELTDVTYTENENWRGSTGSLNFYPKDDILPLWKRNAPVDISIGLGVESFTVVEGEETRPANSEEMAAAEAAARSAMGMLFISDINQERTGEYLGRTHTSIDLTDYVINRMDRKDIYDMQQAGGSTVTEWFTWIGNRLGLSTDRIQISSETVVRTISDVEIECALGDLIIPVGYPIPSTANLAAEDGVSYCQHLDDVCKSLKLRWGWKDGKLFIDGGRTPYAEGATISFTLDEDTADADNVVFAIYPEKSQADYRNAFKIKCDPKSEKVSIKVRYITPTQIVTANNKTLIGDVFTKYIENSNSQQDLNFYNDIINTYGLDVPIEITFETDLKQTLRPEMFVKIGQIGHLGLIANSIFRITEASHYLSGRTADAKSTFKAILEFIPAPS